MVLPIDISECAACQPFIACAVPCIAGFVGGAVQVMRSKNYSTGSFISGMISSVFVSLMFCWVSRDVKYFSDKQNTVYAISGLLGVSSQWVFDVALPRIRRMVLRHAEHEVKKHDS